MMENEEQKTIEQPQPDVATPETAEAPDAPKKKPKFGRAGCFVEFLLYLVAVVIMVGTGFVGFMNNRHDVLVAGIVCSIVYAVAVFTIPYLRRNAYLFILSILLLLTAGWWIYWLQHPNM